MTKDTKHRKNGTNYRNKTYSDIILLRNQTQKLQSGFTAKDFWYFPEFFSSTLEDEDTDD